VRVAHALATNDKRMMRAKDILQGLQYLKDFERDFNKATEKRKIFNGEKSPAKRIRLDNRDAYNEEEQEELEARLEIEEMARYETPEGDTA
jgi:hypothetical protein